MVSNNFGRIGKHFINYVTFDPFRDFFGQRRQGQSFLDQICDEVMKKKLKNQSARHRILINISYFLPYISLPSSSPSPPCPPVPPPPPLLKTLSFVICFLSCVIFLLSSLLKINLVCRLSVYSVLCSPRPSEPCMSQPGTNKKMNEIT